MFQDQKRLQGERPRYTRNLLKMEVECQLQLLSAVRDSKEVVLQKEEEDYFNRNPDLFEFRKRRPQTSHRAQKSKMIPKHLFYKPTQESSRKLRLQTLQQLISQNPAQSQSKTSRDNLTNSLQSINMSNIQAMQSHRDKLQLKDSSALLSQSQAKLYNLMRRSNGQSSSQVVPTFKNRVKRQMSSTILSARTSTSVLKSRQIGPLQGNENLAGFSRKYCSSSLLDFKRNGQEAVSRVKTEDGPVATAYLNFPLDKTFGKESSCYLYFEFTILNDAQNCRDSPIRRSKTFYEDHQPTRNCSFRLGLATLNFQYNKSNIESLSSQQCPLLGDDFHSFGISTHQGTTHLNRKEVKGKKQRLTEPICAKDIVGVLISLGQQSGQHQKQNPVQEDMLKVIPSFIIFDDENRARSASKKQPLWLNRNNSAVSTLEKQRSKIQQRSQSRTVKLEHKLLQDRFIEVFKNGRSIGIVNIPKELFMVTSPLYLAFNIYPQTSLKLNLGQKPFKHDPSKSSLSFRKFQYKPLIEAKTSGE